MEGIEKHSGTWVTLMDWVNDELIEALSALKDPMMDRDLTLATRVRIKTLEEIRDLPKPPKHKPQVEAVPIDAR